MICAKQSWMRSRSGKSLDALTNDDLASFDQFYGNGKQLTERLARLTGLKPSMQVLDVGGGLVGERRRLNLTAALV